MNGDRAEVSALGAGGYAHVSLRLEQHGVDVQEKPDPSFTHLYHWYFHNFPQRNRLPYVTDNEVQGILELFSYTRRTGL